MTYCLGICVAAGIVFASDSRTNAGVDYASVYSKMHDFKPAPDRQFMLLSSGNLALSQEIMYHLRRDLDHPGRLGNLVSVRYLFEAAEYVGKVCLAIQNDHRAALHSSGLSTEITLIFGGQIAGEPHQLFLIYPQGNYVATSSDTPFLQIGETKYGKPVLDRFARFDMSLADAAQLSLVSLEGTVRSNISVGPPYEIAIYAKDSLQIGRRFKFEDDDPFLDQLSDAWHRGLSATFQNLPRYPW